MIILDISIINYFDKGLSWDICIQGFVVCLIFSFSFLYLLYLLPSFHKANQSLVDFYLIEISNKIKSYFTNSSTNDDGVSNLINKFTKIFQLISLSSIVIILSFMFGVVFSNVSDSFMDQNNTIHFGLKKNWTHLRADTGFIETDEAIKIDIFNKFFGKKSLQPNKIKFALDSLKMRTILRNDTNLITDKTRESVIKELYYHSKHKILESDKWSSYLAYTQTLVNLNQTFCFCLWTLMLTSLTGFLVTLIISVKDNIRESSSIHNWYGLTFLSLIIVLVLVNIFIDTNYWWNSTWAFFTLGLFSLILIQFRLIRGYRLTTSVLLVFISIFLYHVTAFSWMTCEVESCAKTYGLLIYMDKELNETTIGIFKQSINAE
jgi:hypothetical protein